MIEYNIYFSFDDYEQFTDILHLIKHYTKNFSIIDMLGYYNGQAEVSKCLKIIGRVKDIKTMIKRMKLIGNQECILLTKSKTKMVLI